MKSQRAMSSLPKWEFWCFKLFVDYKDIRLIFGGLAIRQAVRNPWETEFGARLVLLKASGVLAKALKPRLV